MKTIGQRPLTRSQTRACNDIRLVHGLDSPNKQGKKRPAMKTIDDKRCVNRPRKKMEHEKLPERERDISLVYGLDSPVDGNDVRGPSTKFPLRDITLVYGLDGLDTLMVLYDKRVLISALEFFHRKEARTTTAMDDKGRVFYKSFTSYFRKHREKIMLEAWPTVESSLKSVGISCSLNLFCPIDASIRLMMMRSITFTTTLSTRGGPDIIDKAGDLLEILTESDAPPLLAIQILDGSLQYDIIRIGIINHGFGSQLPFEKQEKLPDLVRSIEPSIKGLAKLSQCDIFLDVETAIALGNSQPGLKLVRYIIRACFFSSVKPATIIRGLNYFVQNGGKLENVVMNILGLEPEEATLFVPSLNQDGMLVCGAFFSELRGKVLGEAWPIVESTLEKYGISCTIYLDEGFMTIFTKDQNMIHKARDVLELLVLTSAAPSRALLVLTDGMKHDIIKTGYQNGGLGKKVNMKKKQFTEQTKLIWACRQDLEEVTLCHIYINENTVAAIAPEPKRLSLVRNLVTRCIVGMEDLASMIEEIKLEPEKKKQKVCHQSSEGFFASMSSEPYVTSVTVSCKKQGL